MVFPWMAQWIFRRSLICRDAGDIFVIPGNIEKTFDQVTKAVSYIYTSGVFPILMGGDHSLGYPNVRGNSAPYRWKCRHYPYRQTH